ncbi:MAG: CoA-transferase [Bacillota bacterium]
MDNKIIKGKEAVKMIRDGDTITMTAAGLIGYPEHLVKCLEEQYKEVGAPKGLTLVSGCGHAVWDHRGDSRFAYPGFLKRAIGTHPDAAPPLRKMLENNEVEAYILPQGILNQLFRAIAAKQAGIISKIGLGTYMDPRLEGGMVNDIAKEPLVELMELKGEEWLFYKTFPINVALVRATTADESGNLTIEREALKLQNLEVASAARASNGIVIAQVERVTKNGTLKAKDVVVPGVLVDAIVITENPEEDHRQTPATYYSPYFSGEMRSPFKMVEEHKEKLEPVDIIARRAVFELFPGAIVNIGIGIGAELGPVADIEGISEKIILTVELGVFGGTPAPIPNFGAAFNPDAFISHANMFDFYHAGGLDITFLGAAQVDKVGNVNVSKFGKRIAGTGGFIDISQSTPKVVFCTYFKAKEFEAVVAEEKLKIIKEGRLVKFVEEVDQVSFSGKIATVQEKEVIVITERAVFKLVDGDLTLTEIAPGIDLEKDIFDQMGFKPVVSKDLKQMNARIFKLGRMGIFD